MVAGAFGDVNKATRCLHFSLRSGDPDVNSQFKVPKGGRSIFLAHPVVCGGRLYLRHGDNLYAHDVKAKLSVP